jgi:hypothetical protein
MLIAWAIFVSPKSRTVHDHKEGAETGTNRTARGIPGQSFDWRMVESEDYVNYIANLRAIGCPEETIRDLIIADVNKLFEDRRKHLFAARTNRYEYWKPAKQRFTHVFDEQKVAAQQALAKERRTVLKELLGFEPEEKIDYMPWNPLEEMLDFLPPSKRVEIMEFEQRFNARQVVLMNNWADANVQQMFEKQREAELAQILSPEDFEAYQVRRSGTANKVASELTAFDPSEQEFRDILKLRKSIEDEFGTTRNGRLGSAATAKMDEELKNLLGDSRYAEYDRSQSSLYKTIYLVADRNGFSKEAADKVYELKTSAETQADSVRRDQSLTWEQRADALAAIRHKADIAAHAVFSHEALLTLESHGSWLSGIAAPASPVPR